MLNTWNTPWLEWVDTERFAAHVQTTAALPTDIVASAHGPVLRGAAIDDAFARTQALAAQPPVPATRTTDAGRAAREPARTGLGLSPLNDTTDENQGN